MELFSLKERIIWNTFSTSPSTWAAAKQLHGASPALGACQVRSSEGRAWPKPPSLGHRFQKTSANHCVKPKSTNSPQPDSLELRVWCFLFWRFPWYLTHPLWNTSCFKWLEFTDPLINYLTQFLINWEEGWAIPLCKYDLILKNPVF